MTKHYELVIVGTGTAAMTAARSMRSAGRTVAVVDFRPFGGTCALRGCDPKKMLFGVTGTVDRVRRMQANGVAGAVQVDWTALMRFKRSFRDPIPRSEERSYADDGIDAFHGRARFTGPTSVDIEGVSVQAGHVLLATGAEPVKLGLAGEELLATSEQFLELASLPRVASSSSAEAISQPSSLILAALSGARVTVLQRGDRMLKRFDAELVDWLMGRFRELGVDVRTNASVQRVERADDGFRVTALRDGVEAVFEADLVVHAGGRAPDFEPLDLDAAGVERESGRLKLNEFLQSTSNPVVYAAGDAAQNGPPLTPVSSHDAKVAVANMLRGNHVRPDYRGVPSVAFTQPPIAGVGLSEDAARAQGLKFRVKSRNASKWFTARQAAEPTYGFKTLVEEGTDIVLGAHLVGPHVDEVINIFGLAIRHGLTAANLKETIFAYPTGASDIGFML